MNAPDARPVALITGASSGLGYVIAQAFLGRGYRLMIVGRVQARLDAACDTLSAQSDGIVIGHQCDLTSAEQVEGLFAQLDATFGRLDVLVNCVGTSDRGLIENLSADHLENLLQQNVFTALVCSQAALPMLERTRGAVVNIGSLGSKVGARYIGGYAIAKHALAGMTQQMRLELKPRGIHVALVSPGPIRRDDAGSRYDDAIDDSVPAQAARPGGGTRLKGLSPERVAAAVLRCAEKRAPDVVLPGYLRILIAIGHAFPRLGDWLLLKFTSSKES